MGISVLSRTAMEQYTRIPSASGEFITVEGEDGEVFIRYNNTRYTGLAEHVLRYGVVYSMSDMNRLHYLKLSEELVGRLRSYFDYKQK